MTTLDAMRAECAHESARLRLNRRICRSLRAMWGGAFGWLGVPHYVPHYPAADYARLVEARCPLP